MKVMRSLIFNMAIALINRLSQMTLSPSNFRRCVLEARASLPSTPSKGKHASFSCVGREQLMIALTKIEKCKRIRVNQSKNDNLPCSQSKLGEEVSPLRGAKVPLNNFRIFNEEDAKNRVKWALVH